MKYILYSIFLLMPLAVLSQQVPDRIVTDYDSSGNQVYRGIEIVFARKTSSFDSTTATKEATVDPFKKTGYNNSRLTYYPNPVQDKLNIEWDLDFKKVNHLILSSSSGQRIQLVSNLVNETSTTVDFFRLAVGVYYLKIVYIDDTEETIKIIKK